MGGSWQRTAEGGRQMEEKKEKNLRRRRRWRSIRHHSARAKGNGLDLSQLSSRVEFLSIEAKVDAAGIADLNDNFFSSMDGPLAARRQDFGWGSLAVGSDRDPGFFAGLDDDGKLSRSWGRGGSGCGLRCLGGGGRSSSRRTICWRSGGANFLVHFVGRFA